MGIEPRSVFGSSRSQANDSSNSELPQAEFWMNIGYSVGEGEDERFVSLPTGIALDTMRPVKANGNGEFAQFRAAQNNLREQILEAAAKLAPGEAILLEGSCQGLQIQIRRRAGDETPAVDGTNKFVTKLSFD